MNNIQLSEIKKPSELPDLPHGLSFFDSYLRHFAREVLGIGGEVQVAAKSEKIVGVFMHDDYENTGSVYTQSLELFNHFRKEKVSSFLYTEVNTNLPREVFDIYTRTLEDAIHHSFRYEVSSPKPDEIERFMRLTHQDVNPSWPRVALKNGDRCFVVKLNGDCVGCGWVSLVNRKGRLHTLYVKPQYRRIGIAEDLRYARLLWLKAKGAKSVFSEISKDNFAAAMGERKINMSPCSHVYMY